MKKFLLCVMAAAAFSAANAVEFASLKADAAAVADDGAESRATTLDLRFSGNLWSWYAIGAVDEVKCYIYVPAEVATKYAGNQITSIVFNAYVTSATTLSGSVFVTEDIEGTPEVQKTVLITKGTGKNTGKFTSNAYTIKEGVGFYIGYSVLKPAYDPNNYIADYPIGLDAGPANQYAGYVEYKSGTAKKTIPLSEVDHNLFIYATTTGDVTEAENIFATGRGTFGNFFTLPVCGAGQEDFLLSMYNCGTNAITSIDYEYSVDGAEPVAVSHETNFSGNTVGFLPMPVELTAARSNVKVDVKKINGIDFDYSTSVEYIAVKEGFDYQRRFVVEEFTGTWCGWCPRGIVGFEGMDESYPDQFIGIAVHYGDAMKSSTYSAFMTKYYQGAPSSIVNRDELYQPDPNFADLKETLEIFDETKAAVVPYITDLTFGADSTSATVQTKVAFGFTDTAANYKIAFVVLEDSVAGRQTNYYAGGSNGAMGGWESMGQTVTWQYSHVARNIYSVWGIDNSLPAEVKAGEEYEYTYDLSFKGVKKAKIKDAHVVMLVIDGATGTILNACKGGPTSGWTGIANVAAEKAAAKVYGLDGKIAIEGEYANVQVFTISGQQVGRTEGLAAGIYVVCVDGKPFKVSVK